MKLAFLVILVLGSGASFATDPSWRWVKASNIVAKGWDLSDGIADVSMDGAKFTARLFRKQSKSEFQIVLDGTIKNGRITAKEIIQGSDYTGSVFHGTIERKKWGEEFAGTTGAESITLSDGWNMIGITRDPH